VQFFFAIATHSHYIHRFYGESFPTPPQEGTPGYLRGDENEDAAQKVDLTHLSSRQAIQDIVSFVKSKEALQHFKLSNEQDAKGVRWITFGGSYPGMLSAWSHLLHPTTIFGAVSNSAPIQAELNFHQYHEHVGMDLENEEVGGSKECRKIIEEGHEQAVAILESQTSFEADGKKAVDEDSSEDGHGLERLALMFNICGGADTLRASRRNQEVFIGDGIITIPAQSNDPSCTTGKVCNIKGLCDTILTERKNSPMKSSLDILGDVNQLQKKTQPGGGEQCTVVEWKAWLYFWKQDFTPTTQNVNDYSWVYQTCNEFGFYQTCNKDSNCPYGKGYHDIDRDLEICQEAFGMDADTVKQNVASTLTYYGGRSLTPNTGQDRVGPSNDMIVDGEDTVVDGQNRLIFLNGDIDPWEELSFNDGTDITPSDSVQGASHHFWTQMIKETDSASVVEARATIYKTVTDWLEQPTHLVSVGGDTVMETE